MSEAELAAVQDWMLRRVTAGIWGQRFAGDGVDAEQIVVGSSNLSADSRLDIYARSYVMRLAECLRAEFPVLRALIGEAVFDLFTGGYLSARPPRSPSLYDLGGGFADYLEATRPQPHSGAGTMEALPASLARLERAISESSRARGPEQALNAWQADLAQLLADPSIRLRTPESLQLLQLDFDFTETLAGMGAGVRPEVPPAREAFVAVARSRYRVRAHTIDRLLFSVLQSLRDRDGGVRDAVLAVSRESGRPADEIMSSFFGSVLPAIEHGFVTPEPRSL